MATKAQIYVIGITTILTILTALHLSRLLYKSTLFMQNKPNFMRFWPVNGDCEKKQTQSKPIQSQFKPDQTQFQSQAAQTYEKMQRFRTICNFLQKSPLLLLALGAVVLRDALNYPQVCPLPKPNSPNLGLWLH